MTQGEKQSNSVDLLNDSGINTIAFGKVVNVLGETVMTVERLFDDGTAEGYRKERARSEFPDDKFADSHAVEGEPLEQRIVWKLLPGMRFIIVDYDDDLEGSHPGRNVVHRLQLLDDMRKHLQVQEAD